jgi:hypothetical protein
MSLPVAFPMTVNEQTKMELKKKKDYIKVLCGQSERYDKEFETKRRSSWLPVFDTRSMSGINLPNLLANREQGNLKDWTYQKKAYKLHFESRPRYHVLKWGLDESGDGMEAKISMEFKFHPGCKNGC